MHYRIERSVPSTVSAACALAACPFIVVCKPLAPGFLASFPPNSFLSAANAIYVATTGTDRCNLRDTEQLGVAIAITLALVGWNSHKPDISGTPTRTWLESSVMQPTATTCPHSGML